MNTLQSSNIKRSAKDEREFRVLIGLVHYYVNTGKPVGSNSLKEAGFDDLSSATIRNYFANLEKNGFLIQQHSSGGRIPTDRAYRAYAHEYYNSTFRPPLELEEKFNQLRQVETREVAAFLQKSAEFLSDITNGAIFLSAPRFDHDYITELKLIPIDQFRSLCIIITDFGVIKTEVIQTETKLSAFAAKRIESYFHWRLTGLDQPAFSDQIEAELAQKIYNELMVRYIVNYSNFIDSELYRTGFSKLLTFPEFYDASLLANTLVLFENSHYLREIVEKCSKANQLSFWIGDDLKDFAPAIPSCTIVAIPYYINQNVAGVVGMLGPTRIPYQETFGLIKEFSHSISEALTRNLYKFKISFRQPHSSPQALQKESYKLLLLEEKPQVSPHNG